MAAIEVAKSVFARRGTGPDLLPPASPKLLPMDETAEAPRAKIVDVTVGPISPGLVQFTTDPLFKDL